jgi:hypothetical protein
VIRKDRDLLHLVDGNDHICEKPLIFVLSNEGLWVSLIDEENDDDLRWPRTAETLRFGACGFDEAERLQVMLKGLSCICLRGAQLLT